MSDTYQHTIRRLQNKDERIIGELYDDYGGALYGVIRRIVNDDQIAEDLLQDSFVKIWQNAEKFDPSKGRLYTWMYRIAKNTSINHLKSKAEKIHSNQTEMDDKFQDLKIQKPNIDVIDLRGQVNLLKEKQREIIFLLYFRAFTQQEVADHLDLPLGTVKTRTRMALQALRKIYNDTGSGRNLKIVSTFICLMLTFI